MKNGDTLATGFGQCGKYQEVFDAEAIAALQAVKSALDMATEDITDLNLCLDNRAVAQKITALPTDRPCSSSHIIRETRQHLVDWRGATHVHWIPGHQGLSGNELVDGLAKQGTANGPFLTNDTTMSLSAASRWRKTSLEDDLRNWWQQQKKPHHLPRQLEPPKPWDTSWLNDAPRPLLSRLLSARSAHGDFAKYHIDYHHEDAELTCPHCKQLKEPLHPWQCTGNGKRGLTKNFINKLIRSTKGASYLMKNLDPMWKQYRARAQ